MRVPMPALEGVKVQKKNEGLYKAHAKNETL